MFCDLGPRACYDEGKRVSETLSYAYAKHEKVSVRVARIFNTHGPRMHMNDGRVVSNFILQALRNEPITVRNTMLYNMLINYILFFQFSFLFCRYTVEVIKHVHFNMYLI